MLKMSLLVGIVPLPKKFNLFFLTVGTLGKEKIVILKSAAQKKQTVQSGAYQAQGPHNK